MKKASEGKKMKKRQRRTTRKKKAGAKRVVRKAAPKIRRVKRAARKPAVQKVTKKPKAVKQKTIQPKPTHVQQPQQAQVKPQQFQKELLVGTITHYFTHLGVGVLDITNSELAVGDKIHIQGATTNFTQTVTSMQVDRNPVEKAGKGQSIGLQVNEHVREHDKVYKVEA